MLARCQHLYQQSHLVLDKLSDSLNFWICLLKPGAVPNRTYGAWGSKIGRKNRELNSPAYINVHSTIFKVFFKVY